MEQARGNMSAPEYCTTQQAANLLGISVTYVQQLVEAGMLEAWKTRGGHRRIPLTAVHAYRARINGDGSAARGTDTGGRSVAPAGPGASWAAARSTASPLRDAGGAGRTATGDGAVVGAVVDDGSATEVALMIIEDSPMQRELYNRQLAAWQLPISVTYCENGYQALIQIARSKPDILLADIVMDGIDGYEVITTIIGQPDLRDMHIAIVSGIAAEALAARGGVPAGVVYFQKPISFDELRGYVRACCAAQLRERARRTGPVAQDSH